MIDQEKVINGLECCVDDEPFYHAHCDECPYNGRRPDNMGGCTQLYRDALELLKKQGKTIESLTKEKEALLLERIAELQHNIDALYVVMQDTILVNNVIKQRKEGETSDDR